jgi:hypothetical protein
MSIMSLVITTKKFLKEEITEKFIKKIQDTVNHNIQFVLKKFQDTKNNEHEKIWKKNELREDFSKPKSETKDTIKKEVYESNIATQNIKKELNKVWKPSEKRIKQKSWN